jgi:hypothetical protein
MSSTIRFSAFVSICSVFFACAAPAEDVQSQEGELAAAKKNLEYTCVIDPKGATESIVVRPSYGEVETTNAKGIWSAEDELKIKVATDNVTVTRDGKEVFKILGSSKPGSKLTYKEPAGREGNCDRYEVTKLAPVNTAFAVKGSDLAYTCTTSDGAYELEVGPSYGEIEELEFKSGATTYSDGLSLAGGYSKKDMTTTIVLKDGETGKAQLTITESKGTIAWIGFISTRGSSGGTCEKFSRKKTSL